MSSYVDWNPITVYNAGDIVNYQSQIWVSLQGVNLNHVPSGGAPWWSQAGGTGGSYVNTLNTLTGNLSLVSQNLLLDITPNNPNIEFSLNLPTSVNSLNNQTGTVDLTSTGGSVIITTPVAGEVNLEVPANVSSLNSQTGSVSLQSTGATISITNPLPGVINLEQSGGGGTLTGITAGMGIAVSGTAPTLTVSNTGVLSLTAGNNIQLTAPTGNIIIAAQTPIPMSFSIGGATGFPIAGGVSAIGFFPLNTLTTFGNLLTGSGAFVGVNSGFIMIDLNAYSLSMVSGNTGAIQVRVRRTGDAIFSLAPINIIYPPAAPTTAEVNFSVGYAIIDLSQFRAAYGTAANNANLEICLLNTNTNTVYQAGNVGNSIAWFYPNTIV